jgi:hypothetical protein
VKLILRSLGFKTGLAKAAIHGQLDERDADALPTTRLAVAALTYLTRLCCINNSPSIPTSKPRRNYYTFLRLHGLHLSCLAGERTSSKLLLALEVVCSLLSSLNRYSFLWRVPASPQAITST